MALPSNNHQIADNSILDHFDKQTYLGNQYSVAKSFTVGASEIPLILFQNVQTGVTPNNLAIFQNLIKVIESTASQSIQLNVYINPTFSAAGTALTPINLRPAYGDNAIATVTYSPTVSGNGTLVDSVSAAALTDGSSNLLKILDNNENLLITGIASTSSTAITVIAHWFEL